MKTSSVLDGVPAPLDGAFLFDADPYATPVANLRGATFHRTGHDGKPAVCLQSHTPKRFEQLGCVVSALWHRENVRDVTAPCFGCGVSGISRQDHHYDMLSQPCRKCALGPLTHALNTHPEFAAQRSLFLVETWPPPDEVEEWREWHMEDERQMLRQFAAVDGRDLFIDFEAQVSTMLMLTDPAAAMLSAPFMLWRVPDDLSQLFVEDPSCAQMASGLLRSAFEHDVTVVPSPQPAGETVVDWMRAAAQIVS